MDLSNKSELYLLEVYSDATQYGGLSETNILHHEEEGYIRLQSKFVRDTSGLHLPTNMMFSGIQNCFLCKHYYSHMNGIRVTMRPPSYPTKIGLNIKVAMGQEFEHYVGHIVDTKNPNPERW